MRHPLTPRASIIAALLSLAGCRAYVPSARPLAPAAETVRIAFVQPQLVALARADSMPATRADTIHDATAVYGQVVELRSDTLRLLVTQVARRGRLQYLPSGRGATIDMRAVAGVERWSHSPGRTTVLVSIIAGAALFAVLALAALGEALEES